MNSHQVNPLNKIMQDKNILYSITIIIDLFLLYILFNEYNNAIDKFFIETVLLCHVFFYYALSTENCNVLDLLHMFVFILPLLAIFITNKHIKLDQAYRRKHNELVMIFFFRKYFL